MLVRAMLILAALASGCASVNRNVHYSGFGEVDPGRDQGVLDRFAETRSVDPALNGETVKVLVDTIPEGIEVKDKSIRVLEGYDYELLGKVAMFPGPGSYSYLSTLWFADYESAGLKGLCYPQVVLTWLTLGMWGMLPPAYPCWGGIAQDKATVVNQLKQLAKAAGGNLVIASFADTDPAKTVGVAGFVLKVNLDKLDPKKSKPHKFNET